MIERIPMKIAGKIVASVLVFAAASACRAPAVAPPRECDLQPYLRARLAADTVDCGVFDSFPEHSLQSFLGTQAAACVNSALSQRRNFVLWQADYRAEDPVCLREYACMGPPQSCRDRECPRTLPVITSAWTGQNTGGKYQLRLYKNHTIILPVATIEGGVCTAAPATTFHQLQSALPFDIPSIQCSPDDHIPENELVLAPLQTLCGPPLPAPLSDANPGDTEPNDATLPPDA